MNLFRIGRTQIKLHPGLLLVLFGAFIFGMLGELLQAFLALTLHETFHAVVAHALGYPVAVIEILPFGGVARMEGQAISPRSEFVIAFAGPLCNFVIAGVIAAAMRLYPEIQTVLQYFFTINLSLAFFNLLPALPLDGGRMLRGILLRVLRPRTATLITAWIGIVCAAVLIGISVYMAVFGKCNPFIVIMGVFLLLGAIRELRLMPQMKLQAMIRRKDAFSKGEAVPISNVAIHADMPAIAALRHLSASKYTVLVVLNDDMQILGQLDEGKLLLGMARHGQDVRVGQIV